MPCSLPRWICSVLLGSISALPRRVSSPTARPSRTERTVGIHGIRFEACSSFRRCRWTAAVGEPPNLTFADCVHCLVAFDGSRSTLNRSKSEARRNPLLYEAMVLLDDVVQVRCGSTATTATDFTGLLQVQFGTAEAGPIELMCNHAKPPRL